MDNNNNQTNNLNSIYNHTMPFPTGGLQNFSTNDLGTSALSNGTSNNCGAIAEQMKKHPGTNIQGEVMYPNEDPKSMPTAVAHYLFNKKQFSEENSQENLAWRGILAIIGLSQIRQIDMKIVSHNVTSTDNESKQRIVYCKFLEEINALENINDNNNTTTTYFYTVNVNGCALAILHPEMLVCIFNNYKPASLKNIPWYDSQHCKWLDVATTISDYEKQELAVWLKKIKPSNSTTTPILNNYINNLIPNNNAAADRDNFTNAKNLANNLSIPSTFGDINNANNQWTTLPGLRYDMPEVFSSKLAIVYMARLYDNTAIDLSIENTQYYALLPISAKFSNAFNTQAGITITSATLESDKNNISPITVTITINNGDISLPMAKTYQSDDICYINNFPYFSLWPYIKISNYNNYYLTYFHPDYSHFLDDNAKVTTYDYNGSNIILGNGLQNNVKTKSSIDRYSSNNTQFSWNLSILKDIPRTLSVQLPINGTNYDIGAIEIAPPTIGPGTTQNGTATIAIDFGTSNSVCAIKDTNNNNHYTIFNHTYVHPLSKYTEKPDTKKPDTKKPDEVKLDAVKNFHNFYWQNDDVSGTITGKFPSVVQIYANPTINSTPMEDGRILLSNIYTSDYFSKGNADGIYSNFKVPATAQPTNNQILHTKLFINNIMMNAAIEAKILGYTSVNYIFSYPSAPYLAILEQYWQIGDSFIRGIFNLTQPTQPTQPTVQSMTECDAATNYIINRYYANNIVNATPGFAIVDIGGGTTDISIIRYIPNSDNPTTGTLYKCVQLSVRYAGNQIIGNTLYKFIKNSRTSNTNANSDEYAIFNTSAQNNELISSTIKNTIMKIKNATNIDDYVYNTINILMENPGISITRLVDPARNENVATLSNNLRIKTLSILNILGTAIKEYNGIDSTKGNFNVYFLGGGSQSLNFVSDFNTIASKFLTHIVGDENAYFNVILPQNNIKTEIVDGMLVTNSTPLTDLQQENTTNAQTNICPPVDELLSVVKDYCNNDLPKNATSQTLTVALTNNALLQNNVAQLWNDGVSTINPNIKDSVKKAIYVAKKIEDILQ